MIARPTPIGNVWRASSVLWFLSFAVVLSLYWPALDELGRDPSWLSVLLGPWLGGTLVLGVISVFWKEAQRRVLLIVAVGALFGLLPILAMCLTVGLVYFILAPDDAGGAVPTWLTLIAVSVWWCHREVKSYAKRIAASNFMEREFSIEETKIVLNRPPTTNLEPEPIARDNLLGRFYYRCGPYLVMLIPMAYPLQRLIAGTAGPQSVLFMLSFLGTPLAIHALGRLACGAFLYGFKVRQLEIEHRKPVVFERA